MNGRELFSCVMLVPLMAGACHQPRADETLISPTPHIRAQQPGMTSIPFAFKGTYVTSTKKNEESTEIAIRGDKWLIQFWAFKTVRTILKTDTVYVIDHKARTYHEPDDHEAAMLGVEDVQPGKELTTGPILWTTGKFFQPEVLSDLERVSQTGSYVTFLKKNNGTEQLITIDSNSGMIVKREFPKLIDSMEQGSFRTYKHELRNLSYEVDDSIFALPEGYRLITASEARATPSKLQ